MIIKLLIDGGDMKPGPVIAQKIGPLGINMGKVIQEINKATSGFKGMKVPIDLDVNPKTKEFSVHVFSPPAAELIKKELSLEKGSGEAKKTKVGNIAIEQIISIAKTKQPNMTAASLKSAVRSVVGSCVSLGILVENKEAKEIESEILQGKYDQEIASEKTELSADKKKELLSYFNQLKTKQEEAKRKEEEAKKAEEAKAAEAKAAAPTAAAGAAAPAAAGKTDAKAAAPAAGKTEAKKEAKPAAASKPAKPAKK